MTSSHEYDEGVLKAVSNHTRRSILRKIAERGKASYSEIMQILGFDPLVDSGTFNYHLKEIAEVGLIERAENEYRITELGKKVIILMDQIKQDPNVDRHGVLSAAISMTPREEVTLLKNQFALMSGVLLIFVSFITMVFSVGTRSLVFIPAFIAFTFALVLLVESGGNLKRIAQSYKLGLSVLLLLSEDWFLIRSSNRGNFMAFSFFGIICEFTTILYFFLVANGEILWLSGLGVALLAVSIFTAPFAFILADSAIKKAEEMEMIANGG
ncbi:MAG: winged helix-turn-helix domain-containing protein [Candidatus Thorarchaeota archaeon]